MPTPSTHLINSFHQIATINRLKKLLIILLLVVCQLFHPFSASATTNDFYFDSFVADYYLTKDEVEGSKLHVKETLVAVFPEFDQNHGIERYIPLSNQNGHNLTIQNQDALHLKVTRDGISEPFTITKNDNYYTVRIGSKYLYVHGRQEYTIEYDFTRVITEQDIPNRIECIQSPCPEDDHTINVQELYWDTNGTGWRQEFNSLTANVHLGDGISPTNHPNTTTPTSCYVGSFGESGQDRCQTTTLQDGYSFSTNNLKAGENLTFNISFASQTFTIPAKPKSYLLVNIFLVELLVTALVVIIILTKLWPKIRENYHWYKHAPTPPQYTPLKDYTAAQLATVYIKETKEPKVATLLELAVAKKISLIKGEKHKLSKKYHWSIKINSLDHLSDEQYNLLGLLNNGKTPSVGDTYTIQKQNYSTALANAFKAYTNSIIATLKNRGDIIRTPKKQSNHSALRVIFSAFSIVFILCAWSFFTLMSFLSDHLDVYRFDIVAPWLSLPVLLLPILLLITIIILHKRLSPYRNYTRQGLEHSNYVEGLKLYISMAESDRLKFLQSVDGADTSSEGIVKLYEKLLPYAALFGLEQSWLKEMEHYYQEVELDQPDWYDVGLAYALSSHDFSSSFSTPVDPSSYSSSGSSGGGGGGSSGGGGGGGGGGGW